MVTIIVEGGGDQASLKAQCRRAFSTLLEKAGFKNRMPSVRALGGRDAAFDAFNHAHATAVEGTVVILLVDSETLPRSDDAWNHLRMQAGWESPADAEVDQAQLMVACMESWLIADTEAFARYFGKDARRTKLPTTDLEKRTKAEIFRAIEDATSTSKPKGKYGKSRDSFKVLMDVDPSKLRKACIWAERFFAAVNKYS